MNEKTASAFNWHEAIDETYQEFSQQVINYAPQLIGAIALLIAGIVIAHLFRIGTKKFVHGIDSVINRITKNDGAGQKHIKKPYALFFSQFVFWATLSFFFAACANLLGWKIFSGWMDDVMGFLPRFVTGLLIILAGFLLGNATRSGVMSAGSSSGIALSSALGWIAQIVILFSSVIIGIELIGLNVNVLTSIIVVVVGILLAGAALAFSLGAQTMVANLIGAQNTRKHCRVGEYMKIGEYEGEILEVTQTAIVLDGHLGRAVVPAKLFHEQGILLKREEDNV